MKRFAIASTLEFLDDDVIRTNRLRLGQPTVNETYVIPGVRNFDCTDWLADPRQVRCETFVTERSMCLRLLG